jgi:hypothetical protein
MMSLMLAACASPLRPTPATTPSAVPGTVAELAAAIARDAKRSDTETDSKRRDQLASDATVDAQACLAREPEAAACLYGQGVAFGLEARAHPTRAGESLKSMLDFLARAEAADAHYDEAGPARVRALVLLRAPSWPLGPGDAEAGLVAARRAVALNPTYPANLLVLAEALAKTGDAGGAHDTYVRARDAAQTLPASADRDDWLRAADQALPHQ